MSFRLIYFVLLLSTVYARHVPNFSDLDEEEQQLYRAAYDAPSYNQHDDYEEDLPAGKLDLVKDGLWAVKAKIKELKAFNKALAANMLSTKLKLKELMKNHLVPIKTHHHEKPSHNYEYHAPSYQAPAQYEYGAPQYGHATSSAYQEPQYFQPAAPVYHEPQYAPAPTPVYHEPQYAGPQYRHDPYYGH